MTCENSSEEKGGGEGYTKIYIITAEKLDPRNFFC